LQRVAFVDRIVEQWVLELISVGDQIKMAVADDEPKAWARFSSLALCTSTTLVVPGSTEQATLWVEVGARAVWLALESFWSLTRCTAGTEFAAIAMINLSCARQVMYQKLAPRLTIASCSILWEVCIAILFNPH